MVVREGGWVGTVVGAAGVVGWVAAGWAGGMAAGWAAEGSAGPRDSWW